MKLLGTVLPYVGVLISPCDADGMPIGDADDERAAHFETKALVFAWLGRFLALPFGSVEPRMIDPANPRT